MTVTRCAQTSRTPPRSKCQPKVIRDLNPDFRINLDPDVWIAQKMLWGHSLIDGSNFANYGKNQPVTVREMLTNLLKSPNSARVRDIKNNPECISGF